MKKAFTLVWCIVCLLAASSWSIVVLENEPKDDIPQETCIPCELIFRKLESTGKEGEMIQDVSVQLRGEPKSGTGMSYDWASGALVRACDYLEQLFGEILSSVFLVVCFLQEGGC